MECYRRRQRAKQYWLPTLCVDRPVIKLVTYLHQAWLLVDRNGSHKTADHCQQVPTQSTPAISPPPYQQHGALWISQYSSHIHTYGHSDAVQRSFNKQTSMLASACNQVRRQVNRYACRLL